MAKTYERSFCIAPHSWLLLTGQKGGSKQGGRGRSGLGRGGGKRGTPLTITLLIALTDPADGLEPYTPVSFSCIHYSSHSIVFSSNAFCPVYVDFITLFQLPTPTQLVVLDQWRFILLLIHFEQRENSDRLHVSNSVSLRRLKCKFRIHTEFIPADFRPLKWNRLIDASEDTW